MEERNYVFFPVQDKNGAVIRTDNDDELALILKMKRENRPFVLQNIDRIIKDKQKTMCNPIADKSVCLVGHSQLDQWKVDNIAGYKVRNCAVSGISSFEYEEQILNHGLLNCQSDCFIVMHGTNDIVWDYTIEEIGLCIKRNIEYIIQRTNAPIIFLSCIHVNGRIDRSNKRIDELNNNLYKKLCHEVEWIDTSFMDDECGKLNSIYTNDGLHISEMGYEALKMEIINAMKRIGL